MNQPTGLTARVTARLTDAVLDTAIQAADCSAMDHIVILDVSVLRAAIMELAAPELQDAEAALQDAHRELYSERERRTIAQEACLGLHDTVRDAERRLREAEAALAIYRDAKGDQP